MKHLFSLLIISSVVFSANSSLADCSSGTCAPSNTTDNSNTSVNPVTNVTTPVTNQGLAQGTLGQAQTSIMQNSQYNLNGGFAENSFGPGINCQDVGLQISPYATGASAGGFGTSSYGIFGAISIPLGGGSGLCKKLAREIVKQRQLDTCLALLKAGVSIDYALAPELEYCKAFKIVEKPIPVLPVPAPPPPPVQEEVPQNKPVRALW